MNRPCLVWSLVACLFLVNGLMAAPSVGHAAHHSSHQASTHGTGLCAWLCTAGQGIESVTVALEPSMVIVDRRIDSRAFVIESHATLFTELRGPPSSTIL